jgi:hypothetical protein
LLVQGLKDFSGFPIVGIHYFDLELTEVSSNWVSLLILFSVIIYSFCNRTISENHFYFIVATVNVFVKLTFQYYLKSFWTTIKKQYCSLTMVKVIIRCDTIYREVDLEASTCNKWACHFETLQQLCTYYIACSRRFWLFHFIFSHCRACLEGGK